MAAPRLTGRPRRRLRSAAAMLACAAGAGCAATSSPFPLDDATEVAGDERIAPQAEPEPAPEQDLRARADAAEARQDWAAAASALDAWAARHPDEVDAAFRMRRAALADRLGEVLHAIELRRALLAERPGDVWLRVDLADDLQRIGEDRAAVEVLEVYRADREEQRLLWHALVELHERAERFTEAAMNAERIAAMDPPWEDAQRWWYRASGLWERAGDYARATETVERALGDADLADEEEQAMARLRAFQLGRPENVADAVALLRYHEDPDLRLIGAEYLARGRFPDEVPVFEGALDDPDPRVLTTCLYALRERAPRGRSAAVVPLLEHDDPQVRLAAVAALGGLGDADAVPLLLERLQPEDRALFRAARKSLEEVTGHRIGFTLDPDEEQRRELRERWQAWWRSSGSGLER